MVTGTTLLEKRSKAMSEITFNIKKCGAKDAYGHLKQQCEAVAAWLGDSILFTNTGNYFHVWGQLLSICGQFLHIKPDSKEL